MDYKFIADLLADVNVPTEGILSRVLQKDEHVNITLFGLARLISLRATLHLEGRGESPVTTPGCLRQRSRGRRIRVHSHFAVACAKQPRQV